MVEDKDLQLRAYQVQAPASEALFKLLRVIQTREINSFYAIRSRVKRLNDIVEKVERKRGQGKIGYAPEDITDIVGVRIVTLFREDVIEALRICLQMVRHQGLFSATSPLVKDKLVEGIIYTTASVGDPEAITSRLRSIFQDYGFPLAEKDVQQIETGYSSVHLIVHSQVLHEEHLRSVPIEIQIRTVFEDAWGEIDHKLRYSIKKSRRHISGPTLESWEPHLNVLKSLTDGCAQYAGVIKKQAIDSKSRSAEIGPFVPVDGEEDALALLGKCSVGLKEKFSSAYKKRSEAVSSTDASEKSSLWLAASLLFDDANNEIATAEFESPTTENAARFFSRMESAFCLLSEGSKASLDRAIQIYSEMQEQSPNSVIVYYRYGQALSKLNSVDDAINKLVRAEKLLATDIHVPEGHWLRVLIPRQLGFVKWSKSALCEDTEAGRTERLVLLEEAFRDTCRAFERTIADTVGQTRCANNALYYGVEYMALHGSLEAGKITKNDVLRYLHLVEKKMPPSDASRKDMNWLDTLCRAYALLEMESCAVLTAERIEHLLSGSGQASLGTLPPSSELNSPTQSFYAVTENLNERERNVLDHALWVLRRYSSGSTKDRSSSS